MLIEFKIYKADNAEQVSFAKRDEQDEQDEDEQDYIRICGINDGDKIVRIVCKKLSDPNTLSFGVGFCDDECRGCDMCSFTDLIYYECNLTLI